MPQAQTLVRQNRHLLNFSGNFFFKAGRTDFFSLAVVFNFVIKESFGRRNYLHYRQSVIFFSSEIFQNAAGGFPTLDVFFREGLVAVHKRFAKRPDKFRNILSDAYPNRRTAVRGLDDPRREKRFSNFQRFFAEIIFFSESHPSWNFKPGFLENFPSQSFPHGERRGHNA